MKIEAIVLDDKRAVLRPSELKADLHTHSVFSSGSMTVEELARAAVQAGLTHLGITDQETTRHFAAIDQLQERLNLTILAGVEITAFDPANGRPAHILGYDLKFPQIIDDFCQPLRDRRHENTLRQKAILENSGFRFTPNLEKRHEVLFKEHLLADLQQSGQIEDLFGFFYQQWFMNQGPCDFDFEPVNVFDAIRAIKSAGGIPVLAHPGRYKNFNLIRRLLPFGALRS
jgi:predicted metal-dependent phosphoesterase TrpH